MIGWQDTGIAALVLPLRHHTYVRLVSARTGEILIEVKMNGSGVIVRLARHIARSFDSHPAVVQQARARCDEAVTTDGAKGAGDSGVAVRIAVARRDDNVAHAVVGSPGASASATPFS